MRVSDRLSLSETIMRASHPLMIRRLQYKILGSFPRDRSDNVTASLNQFRINCQGFPLVLVCEKSAISPLMYARNKNSILKCSTFPYKLHHQQFDISHKVEILIRWGVTTVNTHEQTHSAHLKQALINFIMRSHLNLVGIMYPKDDRDEVTW